jgi:hypothetical protein
VFTNKSRCSNQLLIILHMYIRWIETLHFGPNRDISK